jgi:hypothetical protein
MEVQVNEVVAGQDVRVQRAGPIQQRRRPRRVGSDGLMPAEPRAAAAQVERKRRQVRAGQQPGTAFVQREQLIKQGSVDDGRWRTGEALLHHDPDAVDLGDQLVPRGRQTGGAGDRHQPARRGRAAGQHRAAPIGPAHIRGTHLATDARSLIDETEACGNVGRREPGNAIPAARRRLFDAGTHTSTPSMPRATARLRQT